MPVVLCSGTTFIRVRSHCLFCLISIFILTIQHTNQLQSVKVATKVLGRSMVKDIESRQDVTLENISLIHDSIDKQAQIIHMEQRKRFLEIQRAQQELQGLREEEEKRRRLLGLLTDVDGRLQHKNLQSERWPGTCEWLVKQRSFQEWFSQNCSSFLACYGIPGSGKTHMCCRGIQFLEEYPSSSTTGLCYHYCTYADKRTLSLVSLYGSLTRQLLEHREIPDHLSTLISDCNKYASCACVSDMSKLFELTCDLYRKVHVVIDGLDELSVDDHQPLLVSLKKISQKVVMKCLITSRQQE